MVNLLGCPFCGGNPTLINGGPGNCYVRCTKCKSSSNDVSRDRATELWNTRALSIPNAPGEQREDKRANQVIGEAIKKHTYGSIRGTLTKAIVSELHRNGFSILALPCADEAAIRADEREKCAKIAGDRGWMGRPYPGFDIAEAIRNLKAEDKSAVCGKEDEPTIGGHKAFSFLHGLVSGNINGPTQDNLSSVIHWAFAEISQLRRATIRNGGKQP